MPAENDRALRSREQPRFWLIHIATASFAVFFVMLPATLFDWSGATAFYVVAGLVATVIVWDVARCRSVAIAPEGLSVSGRTFAWDEIEKIGVREVPIARAGIFVELTDAGRRRHGFGAPRYQLGGFGLPPPPPDQADDRFDLYLRAHRDRLETWFALISIYQLGHMRREITTAMTRAGLPLVAAAVVVDAPDSLTIELVGGSIDEVIAGAAQAIGRVLPERVRWDPAFTGGVMVLVGPLALGEDPRAEACLDAVKTAARSQIAGTPRAVAAMFAARSG